MGTAEGRETCRQYWTSTCTSEYRILSSSGNEEYCLVSRKTASETSIDFRRSDKESRQPDDDDRQRRKADVDQGQNKRSEEVDDCNIDPENFLSSDDALSDYARLNQICPETNRSKEVSSIGTNRPSSKSNDNSREDCQCINGDRQQWWDLEVSEPDLVESNKSFVPDDQSLSEIIDGIHGKNGDTWHCKNELSSSIFTANKDVMDDKVPAVSFVSCKQMPQPSKENYHQRASGVWPACSFRPSGQRKISWVGDGFFKRRRFARIDLHPLSRKINERALGHGGTLVPVKESRQTAGDIGSCDRVLPVSVSKLVKYFENLAILGRKSHGAKKSEKHQDHQSSSKGNPHAVLKFEKDCANSIADPELLLTSKNPEGPCSLLSQLARDSRAQKKTMTTENTRLVIEKPQASDLIQIEILVPGNEYFDQNVAAISDESDPVLMPFTLDSQQDRRCGSGSQQIQRTNTGMSTLYTDPDSHGDYPSILSEQSGYNTPDNLDKSLQNTDILLKNTSQMSLDILNKFSKQNNRMGLDNPNIFSEQIGPKMSPNLDIFPKQDSLRISSNLDNVLEQNGLKSSGNLDNFPKQEGLKMPGNFRGEAFSEIVDDSNILEVEGLFRHLQPKDKNSAKNENVRPLVDENIKRTTSIGSQQFYHSVPEKRLVKLPASNKSNVIATFPTKKDCRLPKSKRGGCARKIIVITVGVFVFFVVWSFLLKI